MGLITYTQISDNTPATANSLNQRFGLLVGAINGNIDSANLKNAAVTNAKIADGAVTDAKLADATITPAKFDAIAFRAKSSATDQPITHDVDTKLDIDTVDFDYGDNFDTDNNRFVAPVRGIYQFNARASFKTASNLNGNLVSIRLKINGITGIEGTSMNAGGNNTHGVIASATLFLDIGDYVEVFAQRNTNSGVMTGANSDFSGFCVGAITT